MNDRRFTNAGLRCSVQASLSPFPQLTKRTSSMQIQPMVFLALVRRANLPVQKVPCIFAESDKMCVDMGVKAPSMQREAFADSLNPGIHLSKYRPLPRRSRMQSLLACMSATADDEASSQASHRSPQLGRDGTGVSMGHVVDVSPWLGESDLDSR